jgi:cyclophilin family peptidyl-prolyl cis-trans isomerase
VTNFLKYVDQGLYNNTVVARSIPGFIVQMGGYKQATGFPHITTFDPVPTEFAAAKAAAGGGDVNVRGTVAMALVPAEQGGGPSSGTSEFFVNLANNASNLDNQNGGFTTFARVIGGGMHVADAIAGLPTSDQSSLNQAFSDVPLLSTPTGTNFVQITSAKAQRVLPVTLDSKTKFVTWKDEKGGTATISLSKGTADLTFVGGTDMNFKERGNHVFVTGKNVTLDTVATHGTNGSSALNVQSNGGKGGAHIGDITADAALGSINANSVQVTGDITSTAAIGRINLQGTYRTRITAVGGALRLSIGTAIDTSVNVGTGTIQSMTAGRWGDDGQVATSITAGKLNSMRVNGNFSTNMSISGDVGQVVVNGNVDTLGSRQWTFGGKVESVRVGKVMGLTATVKGNLGKFKAREVLSDQATTVPTTIAAGSIGAVNVATLTNRSTVSATGGIKSVTVSGLMDSSTIRSGGSIGSVRVGTLTGNQAGSGGARVASAIYAGVAGSVVNGSLVNAKANFTSSTATIQNVTVRDRFSNTDIAAPILGIMKLGTIQTANPTAFGLSAVTRIGQVVGTTAKGKPVALHDVRSTAQATSYFSDHKIDRENFNVLIVTA